MKKMVSGAFWLFILILCALAAGCSFFTRLTFDGIYSIEGREYKSVEFFCSDLVGNRDFYSASNKYEGDFLTSKGETCKKIKNPNFDLYEVIDPKGEAYVSVVVCASEDFDRMVAFYSENLNNNFFVGKLGYPTNYVSVCSAFYDVGDGVFASDDSDFRDLMDFCKKYEVTPYTSINKIRNNEKNADCYVESDFANDSIVKIFRTSKDGYFYSNRPDTFLYKNGKLSLFYVVDGDYYYYIPFSASLDARFSAIVKDSLAKTAVNLESYPAGYFFKVE